MQGFLENDEEMNMEMSARIQNNDLTIGSGNGLPNIIGEDNVNHSPNNDSIHNDYMDGSNDDHAHVEEQITIESNAREILDSINIQADGQPHDNDITHMARTPLYPGAKCSILQAVLPLLNLKVVHGWTNNSFTDLLQ